MGESGGRAHAREISQHRDEGDRPAELFRSALPVSRHPRQSAPPLRRLRPRALVLGHGHHAHAVLVASVRDAVHRRAALAEKSNKPTLSTHIHTTWPSVVEAIGHTGLYDYVEFVGEYGPFDLHDLDNLARAGDVHNMSMQLKVDQEPRGFLAQRAIGSGFHSILFADCRSAADVQECVRIVRAETPEDGGTYGVATRRFTYMGYGGTKEYVQALRDIVVVIMIEKPGTVDTLEDVLAVEGVDMVQWGGSDYSMGIGRAGERYTPELRAIERRVFETAIKMGVPPRAEINTADQAKYFLDMGVRHFCIGTDITILHQWWKSQGEDLRKALGGS